MSNALRRHSPRPHDTLDVAEQLTVTLPRPPAALAPENDFVPPEVATSDTCDLRNGTIDDSGPAEQTSRLVIKECEPECIASGVYVTPGRWDLWFEVTQSRMRGHRILVKWRSGRIYEQIASPEGTIEKLMVFDADVLAAVRGSVEDEAIVSDFVHRREHEAASYLRVLDLFEAIRWIAPGPFDRVTLAAMDLIMRAGSAIA